ncbi:uncharacterized protein LOC135830123 [Sycon ciliatum]|uniref:uncharacterized protein LOC135830123 n=1 Tax=Sycon ciliatum TaxID=27933 RepID=UPI0031F621E1
MAACELHDFKPCPPDRKPDRTIVIIGKTGNGKSTLANSIAGRYDGDLFPESDSPMSETLGRPTHKVLVSYGGEELAVKIVDTIGYGDNRLSEEKVLVALAELAHECDDGIHQLLFVTRGRFTKEEQDTIDKMINVIFQPDVAQFSTLVRTATPAKDLAPAVIDQKTADYWRQLIEIDPRLRRIPTFLMVSNPDGGDESSIEMRRKTRERLMEHIVLHYRKKYIPPLFPDIQARIGKEMEAKNALQDEVDELKRQLETSAISQKEFMEKQGEIFKEMMRVNQELVKKMESMKRGGGMCTIL